MHWSPRSQRPRHIQKFVSHVGCAPLVNVFPAPHDHDESPVFCRCRQEPCRRPRGHVPLVANHSWRPCDACSRCGIPRMISPHDARSVGPIRGCPILIFHESSQVDKWLGKKRALFVKCAHLHCMDQWNKRRRNAAFDAQCRNCFAG